MSNNLKWKTLKFPNLMADNLLSIIAITNLPSKHCMAQTYEGKTCGYIGN
jgi:hypothetical protein